MQFDGLVAIIPAWNEEESIGPVVEGLVSAGVPHIIVADNNSTDNTAAVATAAGAQVIHAQQRGYGSACLAALAHVPEHCTAVVFCDGDGADDIRSLSDLTLPILNNQYDLLIGSRLRGSYDKGAMTPPQLFGNKLAAWLMRLLYKVPASDLGPFRCVSTAALKKLEMSDPAFGWTAEMQVKAFRLGLRTAEIPVHGLNRLAGESKISGKLLPVFKAGWAIISTIIKYHRARLPQQQTGNAQLTVLPTSLKAPQNT